MFFQPARLFRRPHIFPLTYVRRHNSSNQHYLTENPLVAKVQEFRAAVSHMKETDRAQRLYSELMSEVAEQDRVILALLQCLSGNFASTIRRNLVTEHILPSPTLLRRFLPVLLDTTYNAPDDPVLEALQEKVIEVFGAASSQAERALELRAYTCLKSKDENHLASLVRSWPSSSPVSSPQRSVSFSNAQICLSLLRNSRSGVEAVWNDMQAAQLPPSRTTLTLLLRLCASISDTVAARRIFMELPRIYGVPRLLKHFTSYLVLTQRMAQHKLSLEALHLLERQGLHHTRFTLECGFHSASFTSRPKLVEAFLRYAFTPHAETPCVLFDATREHQRLVDFPHAPQLLGCALAASTFNAIAGRARRDGSLQSLRNTVATIEKECGENAKMLRESIEHMNDLDWQAFKTMEPSCTSNKKRPPKRSRFKKKSLV